MGVVLDDGERLLGHMTNGVWSYRLRNSIGFALVASGCAADEAVQVREGAASRASRLVELPFI